MPSPASPVDALFAGLDTTQLFLDSLIGWRKQLIDGGFTPEATEALIVNMVIQPRQ